MSDQFFWYVTRSAALVSWLSASLSLLVGLATSSRLLGRRPTIPWLVDFHRLLAAMAVVFLGVHMLSLWLDGYVEFGPAELLIPWVATVPGLTRTSITLGVIAAWLLAAVQVTSLIKDRLPDTVWRTVHLSSFGTVAAGTVHAIQAGSDTGNPLVVGLGVSMLTAIALATAVRAVRLRDAARAQQTAPVPRGASPDPGRVRVRSEVAARSDRRDHQRPDAPSDPLRRTAAKRRAKPSTGGSRAAKPVGPRGAAVKPVGPRGRAVNPAGRGRADGSRSRPIEPRSNDPGSLPVDPASRRSGTRPGVVRRPE